MKEVITIKQLLEFSNNELSKLGIESYKIDSLAIIGNDLSISKEQIIFDSYLELSEAQVEKVKNSIKRRAQREPVSHIIGKRGFYQDEFVVNSNVLDPRPDSESLIEAILELFPNKDLPLEIAELGVGSGCLILTVLKNFSHAKAVGSDLSIKALEIASLNAKNLKLENRIEFIESDWFKNFPSTKFDIIISNPPYINTNQIELLQEEVRIFEPRLALDGGLNGLDCYEIIAQDVAKFLKKDGHLFLEIGKGQEEDVIAIFTQNGLNFLKSRKDLGGVIRCLVFTNKS